FEEAVNASDMGVPVHQVKEFSPRFSFGCSISSPLYLALAMQGFSGGLGYVERHWRQMAIFYSMVADGVGFVRPLPRFRDPLVAYRLGPVGVRNTLDGMERLAECLFAAGAVELFPSIEGAQALRSMDDVRRLRREASPDRLQLMTIHLFSSNPMGELEGRCA